MKTIKEPAIQCWHYRTGMDVLSTNIRNPESHQIWISFPHYISFPTQPGIHWSPNINSKNLQWFFLLWSWMSSYDWYFHVSGLEQDGLHLHHHHFLVFVSSFFLSVSCPIARFPPALAVPWHPSGPRRPGWWEKLEPSGEMKAAQLSGHTQRTKNCNTHQIVSWESPCTTASIDWLTWWFHGSSIILREKHCPCR